MSWTTVPTKNPGDPVTAENWNGLVGNFAAIADGEPGAPRIAVPGGVATGETDPQAVLHADGAGGVRWARTSLETRTGTIRLVGVNVGTWLVHGLAYYAPLPRDGTPAQYIGAALLVNGAVAFQMAMLNGVNAITMFSMVGADCVLATGVDGSGAAINRGMIGVRIG